MIHPIKVYLHFIFNAKGKHGTHSPFVYNLIDDVLLAKKKYYAFEALELLRKKLELDFTEIKITDFGAGSKKQNAGKRTISQLVKHSAKKPKYARILFQLANKFEANSILELGTSLGISTAYISKARKNAKITTLEGCPNIAAKAQQNFDLLNLSNIKLVVGNFDDTLPSILDKNALFDLIFIDGNHRKDATLNYFNLLLPFVHKNSVLIFDDIHWSKEMEAAWNMISSHPKATVTIDLWEMGLVFFRTEQTKQHFVLKIK